MRPTEADSELLASMKFSNGKWYTSGNIDRRKYDRLETIGWVKGVPTNISDVEYALTESGRAQLAMAETAEAMRRDLPDPAPGGFQSQVNSDLRRGPILKLVAGSQYRVGDLLFLVERIDGDVVTVKFSSGDTTMLHAAAILHSPAGLHEG